MAYAYSADLDQTSLEGAVWSDFTLVASYKPFKKKMHKKQKWNKLFEILGRLW